MKVLEEIKEQDTAKKLSVDEIFENLNFLKLKQMANQFLQLDDQKLEEFTRKYSSVIIYILNIIDSQLARKLVQKLTLNSILHIIEEEARLILLSTFQFEGSLEIIEKINFLLEEIDKPVSENFLSLKKFKETELAFQIIIKNKYEKSFSRFIYLEILDEQAMKKIFDLIFNTKPVLMGILILFSSAKFQKLILNFIIDNIPEFLKVLPAEVYDLKFYTLLREKTNKIVEYLPKEIIDKLEYLEIVKRLEEGLDKSFHQFKNQQISERDRKEKILNQIYELLISEPPEIQDLLLIDLLNKNYINSEESELMRLIFKNKGFK